MLNIFRVASLCEGLSFLLILSVSVGLIGRELVFSIGMAHGVLFLVYFVWSLLVSHKQSWSVMVWLLVLLASIVPFAFIVIEVFMQKELENSTVSTYE